MENDEMETVGVVPRLEQQDRALGQYVRLKAGLAAAKQRLDALGNAMRELGSEIKSQNVGRLVGIAFADHAWLNQDALRSVIQEIVTAQLELEQARDAAVRLGVSVPKD
jgi:hypothetical protein